MLFVRSLNQVSAYTSQVKWWQEERTFSKTVVTLDITIDSVQEGVRSGGHRPTAALIARMVSAVSGYEFAFNSKMSIRRV